MNGRNELRLYYRAIIRRVWLVILLAVMVAGGAYWRMRAAGPRYAATTTLFVTAPLISATPQVHDGTSSQVQLPTPSVGMVINDMTNLLRSRPVTEPVGRQFGLSPDEVRAAVGATRIRDTDLMRIRAVAKSPERAAELANGSATQLIRHFREVSRRDARDVRLFIEQQLTQARTKLDESDREILAYKQSHGILDLDEELASASEAISGLRSDRDNTLLRSREIEAKLTAARKRLAREAQMRVVSGTLKDNQLFLQFESRLGELEVQRATLSQMYTAQHPKLKNVLGEIAAVRRNLYATAKKVIDDEVTQTNPIFDQLMEQLATLEVERASNEARLMAVGFLERRWRADRLRLPMVSLGFAQLTRENNVLAQTYENLSEKYQDALLRENEAGYLRAGVSVMEAAIPPARQEGRVPLTLSIAGLIGLAFGALTAVLLDASEDRVRSTHDAEGVAGAPVLATIPVVAPKSTGLPLLMLVVVSLALVFGPMLAKYAPSMTELGGRTAIVVSRLNNQMVALVNWIR